MVDIVQSTAIIGASDTTSSTDKVQGGQPTTTTQGIQQGGIGITNKVEQFVDLIQQNLPLQQFSGAFQDTQIVNPSVFATTIDAEFVVFPKDFSRGVFLAGVVGVTGSIEHVFDRSPFFFTPSEIDPNTIRDISEAQQFLIFSTATIGSYDIFRSTIQTAEIVAGPGSGISGGPSDPTSLPESLRRNSGDSHVLTIHPTAEGFPFTISGSDTVSQVDQSPPFFDELVPNSGTRNVPETSNLQFHIKDISSALDQSTINVRVDDDLIVSVGTTVTGSVWTSASKTVLAPNDIEYIFQRGPAFTTGSIVTVSGEFGDFAAVTNFVEDTYQFQIVGSGGLAGTIIGDFDLTPPVILPTLPVAAATNVSPNTTVQWSLTDNASGVDPSTVKLLLNSGVKIQEDVAVEGSFTRTVNASKGFDYVYTPENSFDFGNTITGSITAEDFDGNSDTVVYEFTTTSSDTLVIEDFFLDLDESTLLTSGTHLRVGVEDLTYGVASGTTTLTLNGAVPSGLLATYSGVSTVSGVIFSLPMEPLVNFREDLVVLVHAENNFPGPFPVIKEQQFTLRPGYDVEWHNKSVASGIVSETVFPYLTNVEVLTGVTNFAKNFNSGSEFTKFLTEYQAKSDLGATIVSNIQVADLSASLTVLNPFFEYDKTITLEIEADDLEGNQFRLTHIFTIEPKPG